MQPVLDAYNCEAKSIDELVAMVEASGRPAWLEPKLDGFRLICHVVSDTHVEMWTRSLKPQHDDTRTKIPHIAEELLKTFPVGTVIDGEVMAMRVLDDGTIENNFETVQSVMLSGIDTAIFKGKTTKLQYSIFDITHNGEMDIRDAPLSTRRKLLETYIDARDDLTYITAVATWPVDADTHWALVKIGFEGSVVKFADTPYLSGKRGKGWYKVKEQPTIDAVIVGYLDGNGKFAGKVGAVLFGQPVMGSPYEKAFMNGQLDKDVKIELMPLPHIVRGQCSGMDDAERDLISQNRDEFLGTVIEVGHNGVFPGGVTLRHPQFKQFRPDKPASDVIWENGTELTGGRK